MANTGILLYLNGDPERRLRVFEITVLRRIFGPKRDELWTAVAQWLRCCVTNRKVAGSIPAGVLGIFH